MYFSDHPLVMTLCKGIRPSLSVSLQVTKVTSGNLLSSHAAWPDCALVGRQQTYGIMRLISTLHLSALFQGPGLGCQRGTSARHPSHPDSVQLLGACPCHNQSQMLQTKQARLSSLETLQLQNVQVSCVAPALGERCA